MGGSVPQVHAGAEQGHQLLLIVGDVPLHDLLTGTQEALKRLNVYYCTHGERETKDVTCVRVESSRLVNSLVLTEHPLDGKQIKINPF